MAGLEQGRVHTLMNVLRSLLIIDSPPKWTWCHTQRAGTALGYAHVEPDRPASYWLSLDPYMDAAPTPRLGSVGTSDHTETDHALEQDYEQSRRLFVTSPHSLKIPPPSVGLRSRQQNTSTSDKHCDHVSVMAPFDLFAISLTVRGYCQVTAGVWRSVVQCGVRGFC